MSLQQQYNHLRHKVEDRTFAAVWCVAIWVVVVLTAIASVIVAQYFGL